MNKELEIILLNMTANGYDLILSGGQMIEAAFVKDLVCPKETWHSFSIENAIYGAVAMALEQDKSIKWYDTYDKTTPIEGEALQDLAKHYKSKCGLCNQ